MIQTENLSVHYNSHTAVRNVSLTLEEGRITACVGPSGCGKSSFLSALNRLVELVPGGSTSGRVFLSAQDVYGRGMSPILLRRRVGMIFQKPNPFPTSIRRNIQLALREHGQKHKKTLDDMTRQVLTDVGLWDEVQHRLDDSALKLSGGQQQRLCIARALALEPQVLLLDEPCSALDPIAAARVEELIRDLTPRYTVLIVTHNLAQARRIADNVAVFWLKDGAGEVIEFGTVEQVFTKPTNATAAEYLSGTRG